MYKSKITFLTTEMAHLPRWLERPLECAVGFCWPKAVVHSLEGVPSENVLAWLADRGSFCPSIRAMDSIRRIGRIFLKFSVDLFFDYPYKLLVKSFTTIEFFALWPHFCANLVCLGLKVEMFEAGCNRTRFELSSLSPLTF
jgi:hypothetical protein